MVDEERILFLGFIVGILMLLCYASDGPEMYNEQPLFCKIEGK